MDGTGRSAGFGRIGGEARPSLYTPVHLASTRPPAADASVPAPARSPRRIDAALGVAAVVVLVLVVAVGFALKSRLADVAPLETASEEAPALDAESDRLNRSAIATYRRRG